MASPLYGIGRSAVHVIITVREAIRARRRIIGDLLLEASATGRLEARNIRNESTYANLVKNRVFRIDFDREARNRLSCKELVAVLDRAEYGMKEGRVYKKAMLEMVRYGTVMTVQRGRVF